MQLGLQGLECALRTSKPFVRRGIADRRSLSSTSFWPSKSKTLTCGFDASLTQSCLSSECSQSGFEPERDLCSSYFDGDHVDVCSKIGYVGPDDHRNPKN